MQKLHRVFITGLSRTSSVKAYLCVGSRLSSTASGSDLGVSNANVGQSDDDGYEQLMRELKDEARSSKRFVDGWAGRFKETCDLVKRAQEPGARGSRLKDLEKAEMCLLHKKNPEVYTVERLAKDYRVMRQRVLAILWLKELEDEAEKLGRPWEDCVEKLLDNHPEFYESRDREFHVASVSRKPDFKVMPEDWDGTPRDADEVHFEISQREDEIKYQKFVRKLELLKRKVAGEIFCHKYSRHRPAEGWKLTVEKLGKGGKMRFVSMPDGSTRRLNELEMMFQRLEAPRSRYATTSKDAIS